MELMAIATLNRYINFDDPNDDEDEDFDYVELIEKTYINNTKSRELCNKYGIYLTTLRIDNDSLILIMIHDRESAVRIPLYKGELFKFPDIKDDETFFQRTEDFLKEFTISFPDFEDIDFGPVGKRFTVENQNDTKKHPLTAL